MGRPENHILVDANIAKSAADPARHPTSAACLAFARVLADRECRTGAALTPALQAEWKRHASRTMIAWLASMESRGRIRRERDQHVRDLRNAVDAVEDEGVRNALVKDIHLSEAAILHGLPVASQDERQRTFLADLAQDYELAGRIQWLNPVREDSGWRDWLRSACLARDVYQCAPQARS